ncbi:Aspartic proteinase CDR1 [Linum perenne]
MNISIGTPPFQILGILDTGSDITWTQCKPCSKCYTQKGALFNPTFSTTYKTVSCPSNACASRNDVVSTPLITDPHRPYLYYLRLEAISVGNIKIPFRGSNSDDRNIVIDSGTTITALPLEFYSKLSSAVEKKIVGGKKVSDQPAFFSLCYVVEPTGLVNVPPITVHFLGADVALPVSNLFYRVNETVSCFAFRGSKGDSLYGNVAQLNFLIGYNLPKRTVSFKPQKCGKT